MEVSSCRARFLWMFSFFFFKQKTAYEMGLHRLQVRRQDSRETAVVPPSVHLAERRRRLRHRQGVCGDRVTRRDQTAEARGYDDFDVRSALRPRLVRNAHVHVALEATVRRKESTGAHRSLPALVDDFLQQSSELRAERCGQR